MATLYDRQGNPVEIPDEQVVDAIASGEYGNQSGVLPMVGQDGKVYEMSYEDAVAASQQGFTFEGAAQRDARELQEQYGDTGSQILAGLAGAARGATFSTSDLLLTKGFGVDPEYLRKIDEANPATSMMGELGTIAAGALLSGGASTGGLLRSALAGPRAAARAGLKLEKGARKLMTPLAEKGLFGRAAQRAISTGAGSSIESALYTGSQMISEAALGNPSEVADNLISEIGYGTLLGFGIGGALGAGFTAASELGKGVGRMSRKTADSMVDMWERQTGNRALPGLKDLAYKAWSKTAGIVTGKGDELAQFGTKEARRIGTQNLDDLTNSLAREGSDLENVIIKDFDTISDFTQELKPSQIQRLVKPGMDDQVIEMSDSVITKLKKQLAEMKDAGVGAYGDQAFIRKLMKNIDNRDFNVDMAAARKGENVSATIHNVLDNLKRDIGKQAKKLGNRAKDSADMATFDAYRNMYEDLRKSLELEDLFGNAAKAQKTLNEGWTQFLESQGYRAKNRLQRVAGGEAFERVFKADPGGFKSFFKNIGNADNDMDMDYWLKHWDDRANVARSHAKAYGWTKSSHPKQMAAIERIESKTKELRKLYDRASKEVGLINQLKSLEEASRASGFAAEVGGLGGFLLGGAPGAAAGFALGSVMNPGRIVRQLATIDRIASKSKGSVRSSISSFARKASKRKGKPSKVKRLVAPTSVGALSRHTGIKDQQEAFTKTVDELTKIASDPNYAADKLESSVASIQNVAPQLATQVQLKARRAISYLTHKMPKNPGRPTVFKSPWKPTPSQIDKMERIVQVFDNPMSVLKDLENGTLSAESVEALGILYPEMYKQIVYQLTENMDKLQDLPYKERMQLSIMFDVPLDPTMEPQFIASMQAAQTRVADPGQPPQQRGMLGGGVDLQSHMSGSQKLQAKG